MHAFVPKNYRSFDFYSIQCTCTNIYNYMSCMLCIEHTHRSTEALTHTCMPISVSPFKGVVPVYQLVPQMPASSGTNRSCDKTLVGSLITQKDQEWPDRVRNDSPLGQHRNSRGARLLANYTACSAIRRLLWLEGTACNTNAPQPFLNNILPRVSSQVFHWRGNTSGCFGADSMPDLCNASYMPFRTDCRFLNVQFIKIMVLVTTRLNL